MEKNLIYFKYALGALVFLTQDMAHVRKLAKEDGVVLLLCGELRRSVAVC